MRVIFQGFSGKQISVMAELKDMFDGDSNLNYFTADCGRGIWYLDMDFFSKIQGF